MKKFLAIVLAVAMVLSIASVAMAFSWSAPAAKTDDESFGYKIEVIKFTRSTGPLGSSSFNIDSAATAVNGADVYFAIKLTVPDLGEKKPVRVNAKVKITGTAIGFAKKGNMPVGPFNSLDEIDISGLDAGVYYYCNWVKNSKGLPFLTITEINKLCSGTPIFAANCEDTATAEICAQVTSKRPLKGDWFTYGDYGIRVTDTTVEFSVDPNIVLATFTRNSDGKVTAVEDSGETQKVAKLYAWLNAGDINVVYNAVKNGEFYMTDDNIRAAFGWSYKSKSCATWNANSTPIILDPTISIPKTGDNASVIGFAMIMVAVVAAAAAMKKVKA